ncbi:MAG: chemotaxis protein CheW [Gallionella sp.]|nr:chemotaxis protein CheW [Gallionella sp.]
MMAEADDTPVVCDTCQVLMIRLDGLLACVDLNSVERTHSLVAMQAMPGCAPHVAGIMNYAGSSLVVIDLAIRLGLPSSPYTLDTVIMICTHGGQRIGVIVPDIIGVQDLHEQDRQLTREFARYGAAFRASAHTDLGLALLLDAAWLTQAELYPLAA